MGNFAAGQEDAADEDEEEFDMAGEADDSMEINEDEFDPYVYPLLSTLHPLTTHPETLPQVVPPG